MAKPSIFDAMARAQGGTAGPAPGSAPTQGPSIFDAASQYLGGQVRVAEQAAPFLDPQFQITAQERLGGIQDPDTIRQEAETLARLRKQRGAAVKAGQSVEQDAAASGDPGLTERAIAAMRKMVIPGTPVSPDALLELGSAGLTGAKALGDALDYAAGTVRKYTTPGVEAGSRDVSGEEWNRAIEKKAKEDPLSAAGAFYYPTQAVGDAVGGVLGAGMASAFTGIDAASRLIRGEPLTPPNNPDYWKNQALATVQGGQQAAGDLLRQMAADPLTYVSGGVGGAARNTSAAATRALARLGFAAADIEQALVPVVAVLKAEAGTAEGAQKAAQALEVAGKSLGLGDDAARVFVAEVAGPELQFLGRGTARVGLPFEEPLAAAAQKLGVKNPKLGFDVKIPGAPENAIRRAIEQSAVGRAVSSARGGVGIFDPRKGWVRAEQSMARAADRTKNLELAAESQRLMEQLRANGQTDESIRDLLKRTVDPAFEPSALDMTPDLERQIQKAQALRKGPPATVRPGAEVFASDAQGGLLSAKVVRMENGRAVVQFTEGPHAGTFDVLPPAALRARPKLGDVLEGADLAPLRQTRDLSPYARAVRHHDGWVLAEPRPDFRPYAELTPAEQASVDAIDAYFKARSAEIVRAGGEGATSRNLLTGRYIPRIYEAKAGLLEDVLPKPFNYSPTHQRREIRTEGEGPFAQPGGLPLGQAEDAVPAAYLEGKMSLGEILGTYNARHARTLARRGLEDRLAQQFAVGDFPPRGVRFADLELANGTRARVPAFVANAMHSTFDRSLMTVGSALRAHTKIRETAAGRSLLAVVDALEAAKGTFKRNVLSRVPGYHILNSANDMQQMFAFGVNNPAGRWKDAHRVFAGKGVRLDGRMWTSEEILAAARRHNIAVDDIGHLDLDVLPGQAQARQLGRVLKGEAPVSRARQLYDLDLRVGEALTNRARLGMFLDGLDLGMSPAESARRTFDALIDYQALPQGLQMARWVMPFATWMAKSPFVTGRALLRNPARVAGMKRGIEEFLSEQEDPTLQPRKYVSERGWTVPLNKQVAKAVGDARQAFGGSPYDPGTQVHWLPRVSVFDEALNTPLQMAQGNLDPLFLGAGGTLKFLEEFRSGRDLMTKQPLAPTGRSSGGLALLPAGTPGVPSWALADAGQAPLSRYVLPYLPVLGAPPVSTAINQAIWRSDPAAPYTTLGMQRPYAPRNPNNATFYTAANLMSRSPFYEVLPSDQLSNLLNDPAVLQLLKEAQEAEKRKEQALRLRQQGF